MSFVMRAIPAALFDVAMDVSRPLRAIGILGGTLRPEIAANVLTFSMHGKQVVNTE